MNRKLRHGMPCGLAKLSGVLSSFRSPALISGLVSKDLESWREEKGWTIYPILPLEETGRAESWQANFSRLFKYSLTACLESGFSDPGRLCELTERAQLRPTRLDSFSSNSYQVSN